MDISITEAVRLTGTTSRTLRHYDDIGLLPPSRVGANGLRYYDQEALTRLQRILLLRQLGLGLPAIDEALRNSVDDAQALAAHKDLLIQHRQHLDRQIAALDRTISALQEGTPLMTEEMFDGFDHTQYREEVERRWGKDAYQRSDRWWRSIGREGQQAFRAEAAAIGEGWQRAHQQSRPIDGDDVRALAARHIDWIAAGWGGVRPSAEQITGLAEMYVADERFAANYGGVQGAAYVRDALVAYADRPVTGA